MGSNSSNRMVGAVAGTVLTDVEMKHEDSGLWSDKKRSKLLTFHIIVKLIRTFTIVKLIRPIQTKNVSDQTQSSSTVILSLVH